MRSILAALLPVLTFAGSIGVDFFAPIDTKQAQCLASQVDFAVIRAWNG